VSHYYTVTVQDNRFTLSPGEAARVIRIACEKKEEYAKGNKLTHPGAYSIKTNSVTMSAEEIWKIYIRLTKLESAFSGLKSELGLRPIQRQKRGGSIVFFSYQPWPTSVSTRFGCCYRGKE
jgi:hypothetical protein